MNQRLGRTAGSAVCAAPGWERLGKQRGEAKQILNTLLGHSIGWQHHPAVKMWRGHEFALAEYGVFVCQEWKSRGYKDGTEIFFLDVMQSLRLGDFDKSKPAWFGDEAFHLSHRSNLVRKLPDHCQLLWPDCPNNLPYMWPKGER